MSLSIVRCCRLGCEILALQHNQFPRVLRGCTGVGWEINFPLAAIATQHFSFFHCYYLSPWKFAVPFVWVWVWLWMHIRRTMPKDEKLFHLLFSKLTLVRTDPYGGEENLIFKIQYAFVSRCGWWRLCSLCVSGRFNWFHPASQQQGGRVFVRVFKVL